MTKIVDVKARVRVAEGWDEGSEVLVETRESAVFLAIGWEDREKEHGEPYEEVLLSPDEALRIAQALRDAVDVVRTHTKRCLACSRGGSADQDPCVCGASNWEPLK